MPFFSSPFKRKEPPTTVSPEFDGRPTSSRLGAVEAIDLEITVIQGADLTPKDRRFFGLGRLASSDPYVKVLLVQEFPEETPLNSQHRNFRDQMRKVSSSMHHWSRRQIGRPIHHNNNSNNNVSQENATTKKSKKNKSTTTNSDKGSSNSSNQSPNRIKLGRTRTIYKTLHPQWNETIYGSLRGSMAIQHHTPEHPAMLEFHILDEDQLSANDAMGTVKISVPLAKRNVDITQWYDVPPESAPHARGRLQIRIKTTLRWSHILVRGNTFTLTPGTDMQQLQKPSSRANSKAQRPQRTIQVGLSWDVLLEKQPLEEVGSPASLMEAQGEGDSFVSGFNGGLPIPPPPPIKRAVDLDASCVAVSHDGEVIMPDTVYYGNLTNSNDSVWHSGDDRTGESLHPGDNSIHDDETITLQLDRIPNHVMAMYLILTVATPNMTLAEVQSTRVTVRDITPEGTSKHPQYRQHTLCFFNPSTHRDSKDATAMFMLRIARDPSGVTTLPGNNNKPAVSKRWILTPIEDTHPTARDFGSLIPQVKAYSRDLVPHGVHIDPTERVAILRKGGNIRIQDYCSGNALPDKITFGLAWDVTHGENIDLDASAICLDKHLNLVDMVWWKQLHSKDYNIIHHGDEREGDQVGDDELIDLYLHNMTVMGEHNHVQYIGFVINSYSGQKLKDVDRASCHLFDPETNVEMATYALTNAKALDGVTALLVGCLYRAQHSNPLTTQQDEQTSSSTSDNGNNSNNNAAASEGEWCLAIISEPSDGRTVKANVEGFRNYLKRNPLPPAPSATATQDGGSYLEASMPPFVPLAPEGIASPVSSRPTSPLTITSTATTVSTPQRPKAFSPYWK